MQKFSADDIIIITAARPGLWMRERLTPSAWLRMLGEGFSSGYGDTMELLREVDDKIHEWVEDLNTLVSKIKRIKKMPKTIDSGKLVDIAIFLGSINKRLKGINLLGRELEDAHEAYLREFEQEYSLEVPNVEEIYDFPSEGKIATAGFWDDLKNEWVAKKLRTKEDKERKKAIMELVNLAEKTLVSVKRKLADMEEARAVGNVGDYINSLREISLSQQEFESAFVPVYDTYLKESVDRVIEQRRQKTGPKSPKEEKFVPKGLLEEKVPSAVSTIPGTGPETMSVEPETVESVTTKDPRIKIKWPTSEVPSVVPVTGPMSTPAETADFYTMPSPGIPKPFGPETKPSAMQPNWPGTPPSFTLSTKEWLAENPELTPELEAPQTERSPLATSPGKRLSLGLPEVEEAKPGQEWRMASLRRALIKVQHGRFLDELKKAAAQHNDPYLLAAMISKYSGDIDELDPGSSLKLLAIAEGIVGEE